MTFLAVAALGTACTSGKDDAKGVVDDSEPPTDPTQVGKGDDASRTVAVDVQSAHPYANNLNTTYAVPLAGLPSCAQELRLHFASLSTEADYDVVTVEPTGAAKQAFDGVANDTFTQWFPRSGTSVRVRLESDASITRNGFAIDKIEWRGTPTGCPATTHLVCGAGTVDVSPTPGACGCPVSAECVAIADLEISHYAARGFNRHSHQIHGTEASETHPGPADGPQTTVLGQIDGERAAELFARAADLGLLHGGGYDRPVPGTQTLDRLTLTAGGHTVSFTTTENTHDAAVQALIADFEALFECDTPTGTLTCGGGLVCEAATCIEDQSCVCPANYDPVCSTSGTTYSNGCAAACAHAEVAHAGECGVPGDACGTIRGLACKDENRCRFGASVFSYPFPDAGGTCVAKTYCDAPADCADLAHPAVPGAWTCGANKCAWGAGPQWTAVPNGVFETAHPYASSTSVWKDITLPATAQALRLRTASFALEANYDFLEVWVWQNSAWKLAKRYTGTTGPALTEELAGRYFYLKFVSDSSITRQGFKLEAQYR